MALCEKLILQPSFAAKVDAYEIKDAQHNKIIILVLSENAV